MRDPDALNALLDMATSSPPLPGNRAGGIVDDFPPNHEWLAMIESAEEELLSSDDEDSSVKMMSKGLETAQSAEDGLALQELTDPAPDNSASPTPTAELHASQQSRQQLSPGLGSGGTAETSGIATSLAANVDDTHSHRVQIVDTPATRLPAHMVSLSKSLTTAASATVTKPKRSKKPAPTPHSKYGRLLIDLRKPAPDIGPPPKAVKKGFTPRNLSDLSAALTTPWVNRRQTQTLCACIGM